MYSERKLAVHILIIVILLAILYYTHKTYTTMIIYHDQELYARLSNTHPQPQPYSAQ